jgi:hypothetical protein
MPTPFKKLEAKWTRAHINASRAKTPSVRQKHEQERARLFKEMLN